MLVTQILNGPAIELLGVCQRSKAAVEELHEVLKDVPTPLWPGKSHDQPELDVLQVVLNRLIEGWLHHVLGWPRQVKVMDLISPQRTGPDALVEQGENTLDFAVSLDEGKSLAVEVQLANQSRLDSDIRKFEFLHAHGGLGLAVWVLFGAKTAKRADSGLAQDALAVKKTSKAQFPLVILVLDADPQNSVELNSVPGILLPQMLGGKGGRGSSAVQEFVAQALLERVKPSDIRLPEDLAVLCRQRLAEFIENERIRMLKTTLLAVQGLDPAARELLHRSVQLIGSVLSGKEPAAQLAAQAAAPQLDLF